MNKSQPRARGRLALRTSIIFVATYGALMTVVFFWGADPVERQVNLWTAKTAAWALWLLGADGRAHSDVVQSSVSTIRIISECTALYPIVIFASAVLAFPASWKHKLWALLGVPILAAANLIRIVSLCYIELWFPRAADMAHFVVWQSLMVFFTVLIWMLWAARSGSTHESSSA